MPLIAWWLKISLWQAFLLDIGVLLFFLPYTYVYHWGYDVVRERLLLRRACEGY
ncbi:chlorhexidine efflux transporter [Variovorax sp. 2RAF20]